MKPDTKYKATNIPWLTEVPEEWEVKNARILFDENSMTNVNMETTNALQFQFGEIIPKKRLETDENLTRYTIVEKDDIMINGLNLNYDFLTQRIAIEKETGAITPAYISLRPNKRINPMYACFLLKAMDSHKLINGMGTGIRLTLSFSEFKKTPLPLPPLPIQSRIVSYLDSKIAAINKLIEAKKRQVELLKEMKQRVVNEELKGKDKESQRFRTLFFLEKGLNITKADLTKTGIPCVNYGEIHSKYGFEVNTEIHKLPFVDENYLQTNPQSLLKQGDFVFADTSEDVEGSGNFTI